MLKNYIDNFIKDFHKLKHAYSWESLGRIHYIPHKPISQRQSYHRKMQANQAEEHGFSLARRKPRLDRWQNQPLFHYKERVKYINIYL